MSFEDLPMLDQPLKKLILLLFIFLYIPFPFTYGYKYLAADNPDFPTYYWGARLTFEQHRSPYTVNALNDAMAVSGQDVPPYLYPPPSLVVFYPFSRLSYQTAKTMLLAISHICFLLFIYLLFTKILTIDAQLSLRSFIIAAFSMLYVFAYHPIIEVLNSGQIDLIVLVFLCLTWYALKRDSRALMIALPLSLAVLLKTYPILFIILLFTKRRYGAIFWVLVLLLLYCALAYAVLPQTVWRDWLTNVLPTGGYGNSPMNIFSPASASNQSFNGFFSRMFFENGINSPLWRNPMLGRALAYLCSLSVFGVTIAISYLYSQKTADSRGIDLEFSLYLLMIYLVAPLSWEHHLVYILPSAVVAIHALLPKKVNRVPQWLMMASLFIVAWNLPILAITLRRGILMLLISVKLYAVVILWLAFVLQLRHLLRDSPSSPSFELT